MVAQHKMNGVCRSRRRFVIAMSVATLLGPIGLQPRRSDAASGAHIQTVAALKLGVVAETNAQRRYTQFGRLAKADGYAGLAYLYAALATSEAIHAQNYNRVLAALGEPPMEVETREIPVGTAKENLIHAAERELSSIENTYPDLAERIGPEGHAEAISAVEYAWASHKQHLEIISKIRRWSPSQFETVVKKIDERTQRYYVCQVCGSTVTEKPKDPCPVCNKPPSSYRLIASR